VSKALNALKLYAFDHVRPKTTRIERWNDQVKETQVTPRFETCWQVFISQKIKSTKSLDYF